MAGPYYVRSSDGDDGDSGLSWALAKATFGAAVALAAAGERIYVDDDHQEMVAADTTYTFAGTSGNPVEVIVVLTDTTTAVSNYNVATQWIGTTDIYTLTLVGSVYFWGICLRSGSTFTPLSTTLHRVVFENSLVEIFRSGSMKKIEIVDPATHLILIKSDIKFTGTQHFIVLDRQIIFEWVGGNLLFGASGGVNAQLFQPEANGCIGKITGIDFSAWDATGPEYLVKGGVGNIDFKFKGIIVHPTNPPSIISTALISGQVLVDIWDESDNNTVYKFRREYQYGYAQDETTKVITGKALYDGTNEFAVKMVSRATPTPTFYDPWRYHLTTLRETGFAANRTYTVHIAQDHASVQPDVLENDEIWLEVVYPDDSTAKFNITNDKIATPTTTPAAQTTSTESWEGLAATTRLQELAVTIASADGKNGPVEIWVCLAKESKTVYVCPEVYVS